MSFVFSIKKDGFLKVIVRKDSSIRNKDAYEDYLKSFSDVFKGGEPNETILDLDRENPPTYFILRTKLTYAEEQTLQRANVKIKRGDVEMDIAYWTETVRAILHDIEYPPAVPEAKQIKVNKDKDGFASRELIRSLQAYGVIMDLYSAWTLATKDVDEEVTTKN